MLISNEDALKRLNSGGNLINRLRDTKLNGNSRKSAMSLFVAPRLDEKLPEPKKVVEFNPFAKTEEVKTTTIIKAAPVLAETEEVSVSDLIDNHESQTKLSLAHDSALKVLTDSVAMLATKLDDIKPEKLPAVITATSKVVESIRRERNEATKNGKDREVHFHFYTPQQKKVSDYEVIDITS